MIVFVRGRVASLGLGYVDVEAHGVGYRIWVTETLAAALALGAEVTLYTHHHIREDTQQLFGFENETEREWFELLLGVSGVGPKGALQIVAACDYESFAQALAREDVEALCRLPGIGKKTAQRLVLELKDKFRMSMHPGVPKSDRGKHGKVNVGAFASVKMDVIEALKALGYNERQAMDVADHVIGDDPTIPVESALRQCLQYLDRQSPAGVPAKPS